MSQPGDAMRVSDAERDAVVKVLGEHASVGRLTLDELEERSAKALTAKTRADLAALTSDLPADGAGAGAAVSAAVPARPRRPVRWLVSLVGGGRHSGRFRALGSINAVALLGGAEIDLRNAEIEGGELTVNAFALLGGPQIFVPDSVEVEVGGFSVLGGVDVQGSERAPRPGAPVIRICGYALMGGAEVYRLPPDTRGMSAREIRLAALDGRLHGARGGRGLGPLGDGPGEFGFGPGGLRGGRRGHHRHGRSGGW